MKTIAQKQNEQRPVNRVYVAITGELVNRKSVHLRNFALNGKESASNPLLHYTPIVTTNQ